jgi:hypothetical protein
MAICYLCGEKIEGEVSLDHVPPQQFFAPSLRKLHNLDQLVSLPTHETCNTGFGRDEEYFTWSLVPVASGSVAADALLADNAAKFRGGSRQGLGRAVLSEFDSRPGGLFLPNGKIVKRANHSRVSRVHWKIIRGLYHIETGHVLPENIDYLVEIREPEHTGTSDMDEFWEAVKAEPSKGQYQAVFAYKYRRFEANRGTEKATVHVWGTLLWDKLMIFLAHLDPDMSTWPPPKAEGEAAT